MQYWPGSGVGNLSIEVARVEVQNCSAVDSEELTLAGLAEVA